MKFMRLVTLAVFAFAIVCLLEWSPWNDSGDNTVQHARENVRSTFGWRKGHIYSKTMVYANGPRWIKAERFGGFRRTGRKVHLKRVNGEKIVVGFAVYGVRGKPKSRRVERWDGKGGLPLKKKFKVKSGKYRKLALKKVTVLMYRPGYPRPVLPTAN